MEIKLNKHNHQNSYPGDNGILLEPKDKEEDARRRG
jgi:hypothetical protein